MHKTKVELQMQPSTIAVINEEAPSCNISFRNLKYWGSFSLSNFFSSSETAWTAAEPQATLIYFPPQDVLEFLIFNCHEKAPSIKNDINL